MEKQMTDFLGRRNGNPTACLGIASWLIFCLEHTLKAMGCEEELVQISKALPAKAIGHYRPWGTIQKASQARDP